MATGKTNAKHIRVWVDDNTPTARDISASCNDIGEVGFDYEEQDVRGYSDGWVNVSLGHPDSTITLSGPVDNTALVGSHTVFSAIVGDETQLHTVTIQVGIRAAPVAGDPEWEGEYYCQSYKITGDGRYTAVMRPAGATKAVWGVMT